MKKNQRTACTSVLIALVLACGSNVHAQPADESRFVLDLGVGIDFSVNGNVNSGRLGVCRARPQQFCQTRTETCTAQACTSSSVAATS